MSADAQFRAFIDRILRCREAEDEAKEDTKAVYAELKAEGYDKSIVGKLIAELRSREKNSAKVDEQETLLELYRDAYQRASGTGIALTHTHTRATPIPSQDGKTESEGLASAPVTEQPETAQPFSDQPQEGGSDAKSALVPEHSDQDLTIRRWPGKQGTERPPFAETHHDTAPTESVADEISAPHSEQARVSSTASEADPAKPLPLGSWVGHPFNDQGKVA